MDPSTMMNRSSYHRSNLTGSYNLSEIWSFPINNGGGDDGRLEMRSGSTFGGDFSQFGSASVEAAAAASESDSFGGAVEQQSQRRGKRREVDEEFGKSVSTSGGSAMHDAETKRLRSRDGNQNSKGGNNDGEGSSEKGAEQVSSKPAPPEPPKDYIHVRARRGQATDSHSLAERARREKISERMKILQDLVPGCNKVIGKALVLDEIINYIQSLQRQVEFLSMKLEAVNSRMSLGLEGYPTKEFGHQLLFDPSGAPYGSQPSRDYDRGSSPEWLHMQAGGGGGGCCFDRQT